MTDIVLPSQVILDIVVKNEPEGTLDPEDTEKEVELDLDKLQSRTILAIQVWESGCGKVVVGSRVRNVV